MSEHKSGDPKGILINRPRQAIFLAIIVALTFVLSSCGRPHELPLEEVETASLATTDGVAFQPPIGKKEILTGNFDPNVNLAINIFRLDNGQPVGIPLSSGFSTNNGSIKVVYTPNVTEHYQVNWKSKLAKLPDNTTVRIEVRLGDEASASSICNSTDITLSPKCLAYVDVMLAKSPKKRPPNDVFQLKNGATLPIKVHVERQTSTACSNASLSAKAAFPGEELTLTGIPESWDKVAGKITAPSKLAGSYVPVIEDEVNPKIRKIIVPFLSDDSDSSEKVSIEFTDGNYRCRAVVLTVKPLADHTDAEGTTEKVIQRMSQMVDETLTAFKLDRSIFKTPEKIPAQLIGAVVLYNAAENPENINSYRNILDRGSIVVDGEHISIDSSMLDVLFYHSGVLELLSSSEQRTATKAVVKIGGRLRVGQQKLPSNSLVPLGLVDDLLGEAKVTIDTPESLALHLQLQKSADFTRVTSEAVITVSRLISTSLLLCGPLPWCRAAEQVVSLVSRGAIVASIVATVPAVLLPPDFKVAFDVTHPELNEDDINGGRWENVRLTPSPSGTLRTRDIVQMIVRAAFLRSASFMPPGMSKPDEQAIRAVINILVREVPGGDDSVFGPYEWPSFEVSPGDVHKYFSASTVPGGLNAAIKVANEQNRHYEAQRDGSALLQLTSTFANGSLFDDLERSATQQVLVKAIEVRVTPYGAVIKPGETVCFTAEVSNADDPSIEWRAIPDEGSVRGNEYCWTAPALPPPPPPPPPQDCKNPPPPPPEEPTPPEPTPSGDITVTAISTSKTGARATPGAPERKDTGSAHVEEEDENPPPPPPPPGCEEPPAPPQPPCEGCGSSWGDPQITTFDGNYYRYMAVGDYVLARSKAANDPFEVQMRYMKLGTTDRFSVNEAIAMNVDGDIVNVVVNPINVYEPKVYINGKEVERTGGDRDIVRVLPNGGFVDIKASGGGLGTVTWSDLTTIRFKPLEWCECIYYVWLDLPGHRRGAVEGLLGNFDGDRSNDLALPNGQVVLPQNVYGDFRDSWRAPLGSSNSLFVDGPDRWDPNFPRSVLSLEDFTSADRERAETICRQQGVVTPAVLEGCMYDVLVSGDSRWAEGAALVEPASPTLSITPSGAIVSPGSTKVFKALSIGDIGSEIRWDATSGTITSNSDGSITYVAPDTTGEHTITASAAGVSASATVVVVDDSQARGMVMVAAGSTHSLALHSDGTVWAWGENDNGQLGNGNQVDSPVPVQVSNLTDAITIASGWSHSAAVLRDGTVWTWGNDIGTGDSDIPVKVSGLSSVIDVAAGGDHTIALRSDGTVWVWGRNVVYCKLGNCSAVSHIPVQVLDLENVVAIEAGSHHAIALQNNGTLWAWGDNGLGQLGNGMSFGSTIPDQVLNLDNIVAIEAGSDHTIALQNNGTAWAWGHNDWGQIGDGSSFNADIPVQVKSLSNVKAVSAGGSHTLALQVNGTIWAWGYNFYGQLGNGSRTSSVTPIQVTNLNNIVGVSAGEDHTLAVESDGTVWAWGSDRYGQLGNGDSLSSNIPVKIIMP